MKRLAVVFSVVLDIAVFALFLVLTGISAYLSLGCFGAGLEIVGSNVGGNLPSGSNEAAVVSGFKGFIAGFPIAFGVIMLLIAISMIVLAICNLQSSFAGISFVKDGEFANAKQQNRMRAAMRIDFLIGIFLILVFVFLRTMEEYATLLKIALVSGIAAMLGAVCKFPAVKQRTKQQTGRYDSYNPNKRW